MLAGPGVVWELAFGSWVPLQLGFILPAGRRTEFFTPKHMRRAYPLMHPMGRSRATLFEMPASWQASTTLATSL